ncbi:hypothetical protein QQ045_030107 [Rhodiola kirilowii]
MAKSMRCKRVKRLRAIKRDMVEPYYEKKDEAKQTALEAALAAPKLPVREKSSAMELSASVSAPAPAAENTSNSMDLEMDDAAKDNQSLKPKGGIGKKRQFKVGKGKRGSKGKGKGKVRRKNI